MQVYFIDNDDYFQNRLQTADENGVEYDDNDSRAIFYARGVLETVKKLRWYSLSRLDDGISPFVYKESV